MGERNPTKTLLATCAGPAKIDSDHTRKRKGATKHLLFLTMFFHLNPPPDLHDEFDKKIVVKKIWRQSVVEE
ncbi:hypothetical protein LF1_30060 [Rubripirellula obstinata]|uniref:Uncharacterized protein n=1 Tax=Rubripirellula obstinata TaxID=406547 RepID=A0A5B1CIP4_9BACT|nr:hypothetical protein LF1_30060 [Rubripirellula obstinata]